MNRNIIFLGGIGKTNAFGGELSKNKFLLNFLVSHNYSVKLVNSHNARKCPFKLLKLFIYLFFLKRADLVISTSFGNIYWLIKLLYYLNPQRKVYYWCIGGTFHTRVVNGEFNIKYISYIKEIYVEAHLMKRTLSLCGLTNVKVVPNFKAVPYLPDIKKQDSEIVRFVFMSRICPEKGVDLIFECAKCLNTNHYDNKFTIDFWGINYYNNPQDFLAKINEFKNIRYCGELNLTNNSGYDVLSSYDVMLFPTFWYGEGFPGVVIDAFIAGLPVIISDWNFNTEIIENEKTGIVVKSNDVDALLDAMKAMLDKKYNIKEMSRNCRNKAKSYDSDIVLSKVIH